jgi:hypothetical protein
MPFCSINYKKIEAKGKNEAKKILPKIPKEKAFWCNDDQIFGIQKAWHKGSNVLTTISAPEGWKLGLTYY